MPTKRPAPDDTGSLVLALLSDDTTAASRLVAAMGCDLGLIRQRLRAAVS